ncbi:quinoprotein dehydrogenase-associated SoxYZ-like carrier [Rhizobacter sp. AJA081-3]|uniref:quinoprotein dehydrogenase-associated SoxYZ-like carrier n=1 Tax=Rhizobacter sp. AJA081-3 TaxID=2753607 RepID=UPI001AE0CFD1|nr:quinoprotein dehydrogenase-associated SoxYZ-like carrier [Rhizobacter sp. AJA081-3]QTN21206.1 quinoprotein dehydrogenase-associated SoxYZ-like carrier [Rhizobacter sp. AJA081-3]
MNHLARLFALLLLVAAGLSQARNLQPTDDPDASPVWQKVRASLFEGRSIAPAPADMLVLEAPSRAIDAAVVPIAIRSRWPQGAGRYISKLYLIIDANPSPISAIFQFAPESGRAEIETRVRVDAYSHVRAIAETSDGQLFGVTRFVKASGGCSAPAGSDAQAAAASLGQMRFRVEGDLKGRTPVLAQLMIDHPNHSGLAMDQYSRQFTPAHYVRKVDVTYDGKPVFSADVDFSISENPNFRFWFQPQGNGELRATVVDSRELRFVAAQALRDTPK